MAFSWLLRKREHSKPQETTLRAESIILRVENGLLMTFGPDGDPLPPDLVRSICAAGDGDTLTMETGHKVDQSRVLAILDAQQRGPLAEHRSSGWVRAMLGFSGGFEETPSDRLQSEPIGSAPPAPNLADGDEGPDTEWLTPLPFGEAEIKALADADAILVHGLGGGMRLSTGHFDPMLNGWVVRPHEAPVLSVQRTDGADNSAEIDVTAVSIEGKGTRWPVITRHLQLA
ncbi:MAG: hypothetical protein ACR2RA_14525 [Geminicoccaceae bacterium]